MSAGGLRGDLETVRLTTVGIDVGSSTTHAAISRLVLQRQTQALSSRFLVVEREALAHSPVMLTPYREKDGLIDAERVHAFVESTYRDAGLASDEVDTGAVILTGAALERPNARALSERLAGESGRFVCASAGHNLEAILAAHGSGAVVFSRDVDGEVLHIDIGGGTSKLALLHHGEVLDTAAVRIGGRLVIVEDGIVSRVEEAGAAAARAAGVELQPGAVLPQESASAVARQLATALREVACGAPSTLADALMVTPPLRRRPRPVAVTLSGGVAEYIYGRTGERHGDLGADLAGAVAEELGRYLPLGERPLDEVIRATVTGASQFSVQVSGSTVHVGDDVVLPMKNVPVVRMDPVELRDEAAAEAVADAVRTALSRLDLVEGDQSVAVSLPRLAEPRYSMLRALADGLALALPGSARGSVPLLLTLDGDTGMSLGGVLVEEVGFTGPVIALDELQLGELDYVDVGEMVRPAGVVPVVVKTLLF